MRGSPIIALRQRKHELLQSAKAIMASANAGNRDLTTAETQSFDRIQASLGDIEKQLVCCEQELAEEANMEMTPDENSAFALMANGENPAERPHSKRKAVGRVGIKSYADLFGRPRSNGGFPSFASYLKSVKLSSEGLFDPRLQASMTGSDASQSGFLVPEMWASFILNYALESSICMSRCQVWPMSSSTLHVPGVRDDDHSAGVLFGGVSEYWYGEDVTLDEQNVKARLISLHAQKLALLANASSELVEDAASFESILEANLQAAASFFLDRAFLFGSGVTRPLGMLNAGNPALVVVTKNAATASAGFLYEDATAMFLAMAPACRQRATWVFTDGLIPALMKMQLVVRNQANTDNVGGSATPMFTMNADGTGTLLGRPVLFTEKLKAPGTQGDCGFIAFDQYAIGVRREMQLRRSDQVGFKEDSLWYRLTTRVDGQSTWANPLKLSNGETVSPFVTLQARP